MVSFMAISILKHNPILQETNYTQFVTYLQYSNIHFCWYSVRIFYSFWLFSWRNNLKYCIEKEKEETTFFFLSMVIIIDDSLWKIQIVFWAVQGVKKSSISYTVPTFYIPNIQIYLCNYELFWNLDQTYCIQLFKVLYQIPLMHCTVFYSNKIWI